MRPPPRRLLAMIRRGGSQKPDRLLATVMFTDIVGSTGLAREFGDRGWRRLLERHNAIVRRELKRFAGRELDTAGDGFFVMFERPAQAIDCAWAVVEALKSLNIQIRAAVHMGEVEVIGRKVGGIAVHAASRVLALARPGDIYVTGIVHDVVAGSEIRFAEAGTHELRGVPGEWKLYAVEATSTDRALPPEPLPEPAAAAPRDRRLVVAALAVVAILAIVGTTLALAALNRPAPVVPRPQSVVRINPGDGTPNALIDIQDPTEIALDQGIAWVLSVGGRTLNPIGDRGAGPAIGLPAAPTGIATSDGAVWITTGFGSTSGESGLIRVGMTSRRQEQTYPLGEGADGVAVGEGAVWVTNRLDNTLSRVDLTTLVVNGTADVGEQPIAVVVGEGALWVANAIDRTIWRLDPRSLVRTAEISLAANPYDLAIGFGRLWVTSEQGSSVTVIDVATNTIQRTVAMPGPARGIAAGPSDVWVATGYGEVVRIDPAQIDDFSTIAVGGAPQDVAVDANGGWVSIRE